MYIIGKTTQRRYGKDVLREPDYVEYIFIYISVLH